MAMKVREVMTKSPFYCSADASLGAAAEIMWNHNCGFLPVLSPQHRVVGVITDRDMCIAMATRDRLPGQVPVREFFAVDIYSCQPDDDVSIAMKTMVDKMVRRLVVVDADGKLEGVLSVDDIVLRAGPQAGGSLSPENILSTLKQLYDSQLHQTRNKAAHS